jgi:hypothetical protein
VHMQPYTSNPAAAYAGQLSQCSLSADMARMAVSVPCAQSAAAAGLPSQGPGPHNSSPDTLLPVITAGFRPQGAQLLPAHQLCMPQQQQQQQLMPPGALVSQQVSAHSMSPAHTACYQCGSPYGLSPSGMQLSYCLPMPVLQGMMTGAREGPAAAGFLQPQYTQQQQGPGSYMLLPHQLAVSQPAAMGYAVNGLGNTQVCWSWA